MFLLDPRVFLCLLITGYPSAPETVLTSHPTWMAWFKLWREQLLVMLWVGANHFDRSQQQVGSRLKSAVVSVPPVLRRMRQYQYRQARVDSAMKHWSPPLSCSPQVFFQQARCWTGPRKMRKKNGRCHLRRWSSDVLPAGNWDSTVRGRTIKGCGYINYITLINQMHFLSVSIHWCQKGNGASWFTHWGGKFWE